METSNLEADLSEFISLFSEFRVMAQNKVGVNDSNDFDIVAATVIKQANEDLRSSGSNSQRKSGQNSDELHEGGEKSTKSSKKLIGRLVEKLTKDCEQYCSISFFSFPKDFDVKGLIFWLFFGFIITKIYLPL